MKKVTLLCGMLLALTAVAANAAPGLNLRWSNCFSDGGADNRTSACTTTLGNAGSLVGSYELGPDGVLGVTGVEIVIDLASAGATLPAWWTYNAPGGTIGCRGTALTLNAAISGAAVNCFDWAGGAGAGGLAAYRVGQFYGPATARIVAGFAVASATDVPGAAEMFAFNAVITNAKTVGTGACVGCATPVCIALNSINVVPGTAASTFLGAPANGPGSNIATWQGGAGVSSTLGGGCPAATPTKNTTWGSVKSLYHN
ncbi:MAG: hypothetical protein ABL977_12375 [Candidatus Eisenbacteria bacterium]